MHISEPLPRRRQISLTPLVDVIFLLLMFFMLSSTFARFADLDLARQSASAGEAQLPPPAGPADLRGAIVSVSADRLRVNGAETSKTSPANSTRSTTGAPARPSSWPISTRPCRTWSRCWSGHGGRGSPLP
jgi:biopolymer transport protein ExbD